MSSEKMRQWITLVETSFDDRLPLHQCDIDDPLLEGFMALAKQKLGNKAQEIVTSVTNSTQALQAVFHALSNSHYQNTAAFLMKQQLKSMLKQLKLVNPKLYAALWQRFPEGRNLNDFLTAILLVSVAKAYLRKRQLAKIAIGDQTTDLLINALQDWSGKLLDPTGFISVFDALGKILKVGNHILFEPLASMAKKIATSPIN